MLSLDTQARNKCTAFALICKQQHFDCKQYCPSDKFFEGLITSYTTGMLQLFCTYVLNRYIRDDAILVPLLKAISNNLSPQIYCFAPLIVQHIAAKNHEVDVVEAIIRVCEMWQEPYMSVTLHTLRIEEPWLKQYQQQVLTKLDDM